MSVSVRLQARQTQNLTMTPQLAQSIKLLQMGQAELARHLEEMVQTNPLLETGMREEGEIAAQPETEPAQGQEVDAFSVSEALDTDTAALEAKLGTSLENSFDADQPVLPRTGPGTRESRSSGSLDVSIASGGEDGAGFESYLSAPVSLREHLSGQLALARCEADVRLVASLIADNLEADGYLRRPLEDLQAETGASVQTALEALKVVQQLEPAGVGARSLSECLALQLAEKNRLDPAMAMLVEHLELLARRDFKALCGLCGVDMADMMEMVEEIRALDPRPGLAFDGAASEAIIPDAKVSERPDGSYVVELNDEALPRLLVNRQYQAIVSGKGASSEDRAYVSQCLQEASWLVRSLEQRAQTILKTVEEIVRQQDGFLAFGISHLKPMSLRQVADAIGMHESTISRVTTNKYLETPRGVFELKFFFTTAISATDGADAHSAEAVRLKIRQMIEAEKPGAVLSDDAIVADLKARGIDIARRTVAKYREAMHIPSSVQRRREKSAAASLHA